MAKAELLNVELFNSLFLLDVELNVKSVRICFEFMPITMMSIVQTLNGEIFFLDTLQSGEF